MDCFHKLGMTTDQHTHLVSCSWYHQFYKLYEDLATLSHDQFVRICTSD